MSDKDAVAQDDALRPGWYHSDAQTVPVPQFGSLVLHIPRHVQTYWDGEKWTGETRRCRYIKSLPLVVVVAIVVGFVAFSFFVGLALLVAGDMHNASVSGTSPDTSYVGPIVVALMVVGGIFYGLYRWLRSLKAQCAS